MRAGLLIKMKEQESEIAISGVIQGASFKNQNASGKLRMKNIYQTLSFPIIRFQ